MEIKIHVPFYLENTVLQRYRAVFLVIEKKDYATEMLHQLTGIAKETGMTELQISVEKTNIGSIKVIEKNGGVYERSFLYENEFADIYRISI